MFAIKRISTFTISVLFNYPKRNYKGFRVLFFYMKVFITTLKNLNTLECHECYLVYITDKKNIYFLKDRILIDFKKHELKKHYLFLVDNDILSDAMFVEDYFQEPYYKNEQYEINDLVLQKVIQQYLIPLYNLRLTKSDGGYLKQLYERVKRLNLSSLDKYVFENINIIQSDEKIYIAMNHGDFWSGNIVKHKDSFKLIDWDDLSIKSLTFDIFHFYFQKLDADFIKFIDSYKDTKERVIPIVRGILDKTNTVEFIKNYDQYVNCFILERMLKRYD